MGFLTLTKKISSGSNRKKGLRRGSLTKGTETTPTPSMDVPTNINVQRSTRRGLQRKGTINFSTFSLISMPSFTRGISQNLDNPHLDDIWKYDNNVYSAYDVSAELKEPSDDGKEADNDGDQQKKEDEEEDPFFAANPLPAGSTSSSGSSCSDSWGPSSHAPKTPVQRELPTSRTCTNANRTRELIKQFIGDVWNSGDLTRIQAVCSPKILYNTSDSFSTVGQEGVATMVRQIHTFFAEYHCEIHSMVVEGNKAFCRVRYSGKHVRPILGYPATGQVLSWMGASEFTCVNGLILRVWEVADMTSLENQLKEHSGQSRPAI